MTARAIVAVGGWAYPLGYGYGIKTILTTDVFDSWLAHLCDQVAVYRIQMRIDRAEEGHFGDCKPVGEVCQRCASIMTLVTGCTSCREADMSTIKLRKWDSAEYLKTEEDMVMYLQACLEEAGDDAAFIAKALGVIARARGMTGLARDTGLGRESLYKALSEEGNPSFATILKVSHALGLRWTVVAA